MKWWESLSLSLSGGVILISLLHPLWSIGENWHGPSNGLVMPNMSYVKIKKDMVMYDMMMNEVQVPWQVD